MNSARCVHKVSLLNEQLVILSGYNRDIDKNDNKCELFSFETFTFKTIQNCLFPINGYGAS